VSIALPWIGHLEFPLKRQTSLSLSRSIAARAAADNGGRHPVRLDREAAADAVADYGGCAVWPDRESAAQAVTCFLRRRGECGKHEQPSHNESKMSVAHKPWSLPCRAVQLLIAFAVRHG
jgi:hypothetical protein